MSQDSESVHFTEPFEHNADVMSKFSPNGLFLASAVQCKLIVWNSNSKEMQHQFICDDSISKFEWSPDSELVYCVSKQVVIQVWDLSNPVWRYKISEAPLTIIDTIWAPDSRHLLVIIEFHMKLTIWSLISHTVAVVENPKAIENGVTFSNCGRYLAIAQRMKAEDYIGIYTTETWEDLLFFSTETKDLAAIIFSPTDLTISVLESYLEEGKVIFYSVDGRLLGRFSKENTFGFTSLSWSPNGETVAVGDFYGEVIILSTSSYDTVSSYLHPDNIHLENVVVYKSSEKSSSNNVDDGTSKWKLYEVIKERPVSILSLTEQPEKSKPKNIKFEKQTLQYSHDGQYIASIIGSFPKVLFVFDCLKMKLSSIVVHHHKIKSLAWHPTKSLLSICCGSRNLDMWIPTCCIRLMSPFNDAFRITDASWCPKEDYVIINAKEKSSILYLPQFSTECSLET